MGDFSPKIHPGRGGGPDCELIFSKSISYERHTYLPIFSFLSVSMIIPHTYKFFLGWYGFVQLLAGIGNKCHGAFCIKFFDLF